MKIKDKLISNTFYLFTNWVSTTVLFILFWLVLGKTLIPEHYGIVAVALQVVTLLSTLSMFGLKATTTKLIPEFIERKQLDKIPRLVWVSLKISFAVALIFSIGLVVFYFQFPDYIKFSSDVLPFVIISIVSLAIANIFLGIYSGFQNMKKIFLTTLYGDITMLVLSLFLIYIGFGYIGAIIAFMASSIVMALTRFNLKFFKGLGKSNIEKSVVLKYSMPVFVVLVFTIIFNNSQFIVLSVMDTIETTGLFAVSMKIASVVSIIPTVFSSALFPIISGLSVGKDAESKQSYLISLVFRYGIFIVIPVAIFIILFSKQFVLFFSTAEYLSATTFLPLLVLGAVSLGLANQFLSSIYAIGKPKKYRDINIVATTFYIITALILTYYFSAMGLAISYFISSTVLMLITFMVIRKHLSIKVPTKVIGKVFIAIIPPSLILFLVEPFVPNIWIAGIVLIVSALVYFLSLLKMNFYIDEDIRVLEFIISKTPILKSQISHFRDYLSKFISKSYMESIE